MIVTYPWSKEKEEDSEDPEEDSEDHSTSVDIVPVAWEPGDQSSDDEDEDEAVVFRKYAGVGPVDQEKFWLRSLFVVIAGHDTTTATHVDEMCWSTETSLSDKKKYWLVTK